MPLRKSMALARVYWEMRFMIRSFLLLLMAEALKEGAGAEGAGAEGAGAEGAGAEGAGAGGAVGCGT